MESLPSPPAALARVIEAASDPGVNVAELGKLVSSDPVLAGQILSTVNSSLYSRGKKIRSIERAVSVLGVRSLRNIALCVAVRACVHRRELGDFDLNRFWENSLRCAVAGQMLAEADPSCGVDPMEAFTVGLVQNLGVLLLIRSKPEAATEWMEGCCGGTEKRRATERRLFGCTHDEAGARLADAWALPAELAEPVRHHHAPEEAPAAHAKASRIANHSENIASLLGRVEMAELVDWVRHQGYDKLIDPIGERVTTVASDLGFRVGVQPSLESILAKANSGLVALNLSYEELVVKLERTVAEKEELAAKLEQRNRELEQLSLTDELTGLPNRRALSGRLQYEIKRAAREGGLVFAIADLDHFKSVNDTWGHDFGDEVLQEVASALVRSVRETDMVARMGGEEFGLLLPNTDLEGAQVVAQRALEAVRSIALQTPDRTPRKFTISIGVASVVGPFKQRASADGVAARLYRAADSALYRSKETGRDRSTNVPRPVPWNAPVAKAA